MDKIRNIAVLLFNGVNILDVAGPIQAFKTTNRFGRDLYSLSFVSTDGTPREACCGLRLETNHICEDDELDDLIVPGGDGVDAAMGDPDIQNLVKNWIAQRKGRRVISVCSGALILANAGVLNGKSATTHWRRSEVVVRKFPDVNWAVNEIYRIDGDIYTSAGVTSGIDLALEIIRRDNGPELALSVARELVVYFKRSGGQNQFAEVLEAQFVNDPAIARLMAAFQQNPGTDWSLESMSDVAGLTPRTLSRRCVEKVGFTPAKTLERFRLKLAKIALENGVDVPRSIEISGFSDFQMMQRAFKRHLGTTVGEYRNKFADVH